MSKLTDIKQKILQLDGGAFQELCDVYLSKLGYTGIMALGMKSGTNKTTRGIPDTYFIKSGYKYILVMYTTQQKGLYEKVYKDICDCLNSDKTGIAVSDIAEIIYCHTSANLTIGQDKKLRDLCITNGILLQLKGIDDKEKIMKIIKVCMDFEKYDSKNTWEIQEGLQYLFSCLSNNKELYLYAVDAYLVNNTPKNLFPDPIIIKLFELVGDKATYEIINKVEYNQKNSWQFSFYKNLPLNVISEQYVQSLYEFLSWNEGDITSKCHDKSGVRTKRQDSWISHFIDCNYGNIRLMQIIFSAITEISPERRKTHILHLIRLNPDPELFINLEIEPNSWGGWGSMIPYMEERIDFLKSLLPELSGLTYLKHKQRIEKDIAKWQQRIEHEQIYEVLEGR
jgi:hypothetical protein